MQAPEHVLIHLPLHPALQESLTALRWQSDAHVLSQVLLHCLQLPSSPPELLPPELLPPELLLPDFFSSSSSSLLHDVRIDDPNKENAKIGNAPLAALLKNSLRDWSSSFFSFFVMTLEIFKMPPNSQIQR